MELVLTVCGCLIANSLTVWYVASMLANNSSEIEEDIKRMIVEAVYDEKAKESN